MAAMLPLATNTKDPKPLWVHFMPETILILGILCYLIVPYYILGFSPLIANPIQTTVIFLSFYTVLQLAVFCFLWFRSKPSQLEDVTAYAKDKESPNLLQGILLSLVCWATLHFACILFGAPLTSHVKETALWALLATSLITIPNMCIIGTSVRSWYQIIVCGKFTNPTERFLYFQSVGCLIGSWASSVVIPLDWDRPWQVWPVPCLVGAQVGYMAAILLSCIVTYREMKTEKVL